MKRNTIFYLVKTTILEWMEDKALRLGAALSFYTVFSIAPLLMIVIAVAGLVLDNSAVKDQILNQLQGLLGPEGSKGIGEMLDKASEPKKGIFASVVGFLTLLFGTTGVVTQLKNALNTIWEVEDRKSGVRGAVKNRVFALGLILAIGFLLLVSLVISAVLTGASERFGTAGFLQVMNFIVSIGVITVLFALIFKYLPDTQVKWRNVWVGSFVTAVMFTIGKTATALYLAKSSVASGYGAAGSLVIILLWVYYNSQILFLGAEFTQVYSSLRGDQPPVRAEVEDEGEKVMRKAAEIDINKEEEEMINQQTSNIHRGFAPSRLHKVSYRAGYQFNRIEHTFKAIKKKLKIAKWGARVVKFLGLKTSLKIGWKGFKFKRKIDELKKDEAA